MAENELKCPNCGNDSFYATQVTAMSVNIYMDRFDKTISVDEEDLKSETINPVLTCSECFKDFHYREIFSEDIQDQFEFKETDY